MPISCFDRLCEQSDSMLTYGDILMNCQHMGVFGKDACDVSLRHSQPGRCRIYRSVCSGVEEVLRQPIDTAIRKRLLGDFAPHSAFAFTLIELLVVIAIIGVLASLLLPALHRAKQSAHSVACQSNLRQWGLALQMYLGDFGKYPPYLMRPVERDLYSPGDGAFWYDRLARYVGARWQSQLERIALTGPVQWAVKSNMLTGVSVCPNYIRLPRAVIGISPIAGAYGYNRAGTRWLLKELGLGGEVLNPVSPGDPANIRPIDESEVVSPSGMIAIGDALFLPAKAGEMLAGLVDLSPDSHMLTAVRPLLQIGHWQNADLSGVIGAVNAIEMRHGGRWNMLCCDGHVENQTTKGWFDFRQDRIVQRWNRDNLPHREDLPPDLR